MRYDHILFIGFGGPEKPEDVLPFLEVVTRGRRIPAERLQEVAQHYEQIGGYSPYNRYTAQLIEKVGKELRDAGVSIPVFTGMRNWHPFLKATAQAIQKKNLTRGLAVILAPHRSEASCRRYKDSWKEACSEAGLEAAHYDYLDRWHEHPYFIEALAGRVEEVLQPLQLPAEKVKLIFTAHSIPTAMLQACPDCRYDEEFRATARHVAEALSLPDYECAYQSRSGRPQDPWLGPDIGEVLKRMAGGGKTAVVVPAGFLCDHAEVLYDLDIEARKTAAHHQIPFYRAATVMDHPAFVRLFSELIAAKCGPVNRPGVIRPGGRVRIHFTVSSGGQVLETTRRRAPLEYTQGGTRILPALQQRLAGKKAGDRFSFSLEPEEAYGPVRPGAFEIVPRSEMPPTPLEVGMTLHEMQKDGRMKIGRVAEIREDAVVMNFNHPMAGKKLDYDIEIIDVV